MRNLWIILLFLVLPLASAQFEDQKVPFLSSLFTEQSVLESQITENKIATPNQKMSATLIYQATKHDASDYIIYVYYYDTYLEQHSGLISEWHAGKSLHRGQKHNLFFTSPRILKEDLSKSNENHYIGVVGVLKLKVPESELSEQELNSPDVQCGFSGQTCWIYERFNDEGEIGTNSFNPPFFYSVPETKRCTPGYTDLPFCDGNKIYHPYVEQDCVKQDLLIKSCGLNECVSGKCVETSCKKTGEVISDLCIDSQLIRKTYDKDCKIIDMNFGICDENPPSLPDTGKLETPEVSCTPVRVNCAGGSEVELFSCESGQLVKNQECPSSEVETSSSPTTNPITSFDKTRANLQNNQNLVGTAVIILLILAIVWLLRR